MAPPRLPPLLYVRVVGPAGMKLVMFRGMAKQQEIPAPAVLGLRPGYVYRLALTGFPNAPGLFLFPTLEVRGSLVLGGRVRNADFPATLIFSEEDVQSVASGAMVTRLILLEPPEDALPQATGPDRPVEIRLLPNQPLTEAAERGLPLLAMHLGQKQMTPFELANAYIPGTMLLPGEKVLPWPRATPCLPWNCYPLVPEGVLSPGNTALVMGRERSRNSRLDWDGQMRGLEPAGTVAEFSDSQGRRHLAHPNNLTLCLPRFILVRRESLPESQVARHSPTSSFNLNTQVVAAGQAALSAEQQRQQLELAKNRLKPSSISNTIGVAFSGRVQGLDIVANLKDLGSVSHVLPGATLAPQRFPERPFKLTKWSDKCGGAPGDTLTFTIHFSNGGNQPITDVVVTDSLPARLEYLEGSAQADREAVFTLQPNDVGSTILRWTFPNPLPAQESGMVKFQVKIR